jgi:hypothetical protein
MTFETIGIPTNENKKYLGIGNITNRDFSIELTTLGVGSPSHHRLQDSVANVFGKRKIRTKNSITFIPEKNVFYATYEEDVTGNLGIIADLATSGSPAGFKNTINNAQFLNKENSFYHKFAEPSGVAQYLICLWTK